jgi:transcriptional regulator with XRE-family HTH domain
MPQTYGTPKGASTSAKRAAGSPNAANVHFGRLVTARRLELGLSQEELAGKMGTSQAQVAQIEGGAALSTEGRQRLIDALGIEPETKPALERARKITRKITNRGVGLAAATIAALWLSAVVVDAGWPRIGLAVAAVAALWLSAFLLERAGSVRVPATAVTAVWISVIGVFLIFNGGAPEVNTGPVGGVGAAIAGPLASPQAQSGVDAALSSSASGKGPSGEAVSALPAVSLSDHGGRCDSPGAAASAPAAVIARGLDPFPWTGTHVIYSRSLACGPRPGIALAGLRAATASSGVYTARRRNALATGSQEGSPSDSQSGSPSASQGGSTSGVNSAVNSVTKPGGGGGRPIGNTVNSVGNTVDSVGNTVNNSLGHVLNTP